MKRIFSTMLIALIFSVCGLSLGNIGCAYGYAEKTTITTNKKQVKVIVKSTTGKSAKIKFVNKSKKEIFFGGSFVLKRYAKHKWKKVQFKKQVAFCNTIYLNERKFRNFTMNFRWKMYFDKKLPKGKYKIKFNDKHVKTARFKIR